MPVFSSIVNEKIHKINLNSIFKYFLEEMTFMIKEIAWNTFKNTGNINTFLELKQIPDLTNNEANNIIKDEIKNKKIGE